MLYYKARIIIDLPQKNNSFFVKVQIILRYLNVIVETRASKKLENLKLKKSSEKRGIYFFYEQTITSLNKMEK